MSATQGRWDREGKAEFQTEFVRHGINVLKPGNRSDRKHRTVRWLFIAPCLVYTLGLLVFCVARAFFPEGIPLFSLLNAIFPFLFAPLVMTFPLALLTRSKGLLVGSFALLAVFVYTNGVLFLPRLPVASKTDSLRVMTFNIGAGPSAADDFVAAIEKQNADIVALQELTPDAAALLQRQLQKEYPYVLVGPRRETTGLLSRYPVLQSEWSQPKGGGRAFLHAVLDWQGRPIHFFAVHAPQPSIRWFAHTIPLGLTTDRLDRTVMSVIEAVDGADGSKIVAGDFNMDDQTLAYARLTHVLGDSYREAGQGFGFTFPNNLSLNGLRLSAPFVRIDYVFHSDEWVAQQAFVNCEQSSDHCYLVAALAPKP